MSYASTSAPSFDLPLPWRDNPIPTSNIQPGVHIELKTSHIAPGMVLWPPPGYPYRVELGFRPDKRKGSGVYNVLFYEMRGRGPPPGDIGYPGDIYLDLTPGAYALYFRGTAEWTQYFLKNRGSARHPLCEELFLSIPMRGQISWQPFSKGIVGLLVHGRAEHLVSEHRAISYLIHEETEFVHPSRLNRASQFDALGPPLKRRKMTDIGTQTSYEDGIASSQHDAGENTDAGEHTDAGEYTGAGEHTERVSPVDISTNSPHAISPDPAPAPVLVKPEPPLPIKSEPKTEPPEWEQQDVASRRGSNVASEDIAEHIAVVLEELKSARAARDSAERARDVAEQERNVLSEDLRKRDAFIEEQATRIDEQDTHVDEQRTRVSEQSTLIVKQSTIIGEQSTRRNKQSTLIDEQATRIDEQDTRINEQNTLIGEQATRIDEQDTLIDKQATRIDLQDTFIDMQDTRINEKNKRINLQDTVIDKLSAYSTQLLRAVKEHKTEIARLRTVEEETRLAAEASESRRLESEGRYNKLKAAVIALGQTG